MTEIVVECVEKIRGTVTKTESGNYHLQIKCLEFPQPVPCRPQKCPTCIFTEDPKYLVDRTREYAKQYDNVWVVE